jgi:hypothetical protein
LLGVCPSLVPRYPWLTGAELIQLQGQNTPDHHTFPRYMHIAEPETTMTDVASIRAERDTGMTGRIAERVVGEVDEKISRASDAQARRMAGLEASQKQLQADVDQIKTLLGQLVEQGR